MMILLIALEKRAAFAPVSALIMAGLLPRSYSVPGTKCSVAALTKWYSTAMDQVNNRWPGGKEENSDATSGRR